MDAVVEMNNSILDDRFQFFLVDSESRLHLVQRQHEVGATDLNRVDVV